MMHFVGKFSIMRVVSSSSLFHFTTKLTQTKIANKSNGGLSLLKRFEVMEKLCISQAFSKMAGRRMYTSHPTPLIHPWP